MGLFDKLKKVIGGTPIEEKTEPREDLSGASLMDLVEKIDSYTTEFVNNLNRSNYFKLETAMVELANRVPTIPLSKRTAFASYSQCYNKFLEVFKKCISLGPKGKEIAQQQANGMSAVLSGMLMVLNQ